MSEDLSTTGRNQLERWAYGRPTSVPDADRARHAALELDRRAAFGTATIGTATIGTATISSTRPDQPSTPQGRATPDASRDPHGPETPLLATAAGDDGPAGTTRWRNPLAVIIIGALVVGGGVALLSVLQSAMTRASSLDIFDRPGTVTEVELISQLEAGSQSVNLGPRALGVLEFGTIIAYTTTASETDESSRDRVCVAVAEYDRPTQSTQITDRKCVDRDAFGAEGLSATLFGIGGRYELAWGPQGDAELSVSISDAQRFVMQPGAEAIFVDMPASVREESYVTSQRLYEQTGLIVEHLRAIVPVPVLLESGSGDALARIPEFDGEWLVAYIASKATESERLACLGVLLDGVQIEGECAPVTGLTGRGLQLTFEREGNTIIVSWPSTGNISTMVSRTN